MFGADLEAKPAKEEAEMADKVISAFARDGKIRLAFSFDRVLIDDFKARIPWQKRQWNGKELKDFKTGIRTPNPSGDNTWIIDLDMLDEVKKLAEDHGYEIQAAVSEIPMAVAADFDCYRQMWQDVPDVLMKKVYKTVAMEMHPDRGGDLGNFQSFNSGWDSVKKERNL